MKRVCCSVVIAVSALLTEQVACADEKNALQVDPQVQAESDRVANGMYGNQGARGRYKQQLAEYLTPEAVAAQKAKYAKYLEDNGIDQDKEIKRVERETKDMLGGDEGYLKKTEKASREMKGIYENNPVVRKAQRMPPRRTDGYLKDRSY